MCSYGSLAHERDSHSFDKGHAHAVGLDQAFASDGILIHAAFIWFGQ